MKSIHHTSLVLSMAVLLAACGGAGEAAPGKPAAKGGDKAAQQAAAVERFRTVSNGQVVLDDGTRLGFWADAEKGVCETTKDSANVQYLMGNDGSRLSVTTSGGQLAPVVYDKSGKKIWELVEYDAPRSATVGITVMAQGVWADAKGKKQKGKMVVTCR